MPDEAIEYPSADGDGPYYQGAGGNAPPDGNFVVAETGAGTKLMEWDATAGEWVVRGAVAMGGNDVTGVGALDADSVSTEEVTTNFINQIAYPDIDGESVDVSEWDVIEIITWGTKEGFSGVMSMWINDDQGGSTGDYEQVSRSDTTFSQSVGNNSFQMIDDAQSGGLGRWTFGPLSAASEAILLGDGQDTNRDNTNRGGLIEGQYNGPDATIESLSFASSGQGRWDQSLIRGVVPR